MIIKNLPHMTDISTPGLLQFQANFSLYPGYYIMGGTLLLGMGRLRSARLPLAGAAPIVEPLLGAALEPLYVTRVSQKIFCYE